MASKDAKEAMETKETKEGRGEITNGTLPQGHSSPAPNCARAIEIVTEIDRPCLREDVLGGSQAARKRIPETFKGGILTKTLTREPRRASR